MPAVPYPPGPSHCSPAALPLAASQLPVTVCMRRKASMDRFEIMLPCIWVDVAVAVCRLMLKKTILHVISAAVYTSPTIHMQLLSKIVVCGERL